MKLIGTKKWQKETFWAKLSRLYWYQNKDVPVQPNRMQPVPVQIQVVLVQPNRMQSVPVQVRAVPVLQCPKCPDCVVLPI